MVPVVILMAKNVRVTKIMCLYFVEFVPGERVNKVNPWVLRMDLGGRLWER